MKIPRSEKEKLFCQYYAETGKGAESAKRAGYQGKNHHQIAYRLKNEYREYILTLVKKDIEDIAPVAIGVLKNLALYAKQESVRLKAVKDLLDRAGLAVKIEQKLTVEHVSDSELDAQLKHLLGDKYEEVLESLTSTKH